MNSNESIFSSFFYILIIEAAVFIFSDAIFIEAAVQNYTATYPNPLPLSNNPPIANNQSVLTDKDQPIIITLTAYDPEINDYLTAKIVSPPSAGNLSEINQNTGGVTYTPNPSFTGVDYFQFIVNDGKIDSNKSGVVTITVGLLKSAFDIETDKKATLNVGISTSTIQENNPTTIIIEGKLASFNNTGINDEEITVSISSDGGSDNKPSYRQTTLTGIKGFYEVTFSDVMLSKGTYTIGATPSANSIYSKLNPVDKLIVFERPMSFNDLYTYLAATALVIGILSFLPRSLIKRKQRNNLCKYMIRINNEYNASFQNKEQCLQHLSKLKNEIIEILKRGFITEEQYGILDKKISEYIQTVS